MEQRVGELEKYLGIEDMDLAYFKTQEGEDLNSKLLFLDDFMRSTESKQFWFKDFITKYKSVEAFLKNDSPFEAQCMELKHKSIFILEWMESL